MRKMIRTLTYGLLGLGLLLGIYLLYFILSYPTLNDVGLALLSNLKKAQGNAVPIQKLYREKGNPADHEVWDRLLKKHVDSVGWVNYQGFEEDRHLLKVYLDGISKNSPTPSWAEAEELAYWINAYNAFTIQLILDNYPVSSIKEIGGGGITMINSPWDLKFFEINGIPMDLNTIEHQIIRVKFQEPRIHFAVNCASISCPKLRNEAYQGNQLDQQLQDQTLFFLSNPVKNRFNKDTLFVSKIFDWFGSDFTNGQTLVSFFEANIGNPIEDNVVMEFVPYDWNLNQKP